MRMPHLAALLALGGAVGATLPADCQVPIYDQSRRIEIPGVSVLPPPERDWALFPVSEQQGLIRLIKLIQNAPPEKPEDARLVLAGVGVIDKGEAKPTPPAEFLEDFTAEFFREGRMRVGEMITRRQRLVGLDAALDESLGATCVRYHRLTEITGQFPAFPDLVATVSTRGLYCSHPHWPQYDVDVTYQQMYAKGQEPLPLGADSDAFLKSLQFTSVRPKASPGLIARYKSHMQTADAAYKAERWSEAETALRAALEVAEYFGPRDINLAMPLYGLASTKTKVGEEAEAERLFRQALDIFDAESGTTDVSAARIHALTLQDLAVLLAKQAGGGQSEAERKPRLDEAEGLLKRALAIREKADPTQVGRTLSNLTQVYVDSGRWAEAAAVAERAAAFYERERGPEDKQVLFELDRLADIYLEQGRLADAEPLIQRVVSGMAKMLGTDHPAIAVRLESYAASLRKAGRGDEASEAEALAQAIRRKRPPKP